MDDKINNECFASILRNPDEPENHANPQNRALRRELRGRRRSVRIGRHLGLSDSSSTESDSSFSTSAAEYLVQVLKQKTKIIRGGGGGISLVFIFEF